MTPEQFLKSVSIFNIISDEYMRKNHVSLRQFAYIINENASDVCKWRAAKKNLTIRVIVTLCRMFNLRPHDLNPDVFPPDLLFQFDRAKNIESKELNKLTTKKTRTKIEK